MFHDDEFCFKIKKIKFIYHVKATPNGMQIVTSVPNCNTNQQHNHTEGGGRGREQGT